jgi:hypothetical protein
LPQVGFALLGESKKSGDSSVNIIWSAHCASPTISTSVKIDYNVISQAHAEAREAAVSVAPEAAEGGAEAKCIHAARQT